MYWRAVPRNEVNMTEMDRIVKVRMTEPGYDGTHGQMREGGVYEFPEEQARRYVKAGVAKPAPLSAHTAREEDRAAVMQDAKKREEIYQAEAEMSAAWDVEVRDVGGAEVALDAAKADLEAREAALKRAQAASKRMAKTETSEEPGPVNTDPGRPA